MLTEYTGEYLGEICDVGELKQRMLQLIHSLGVWATDSHPVSDSEHVAERLRVYGGWLLQNVYMNVPQRALFSLEDRVACVIDALPVWVIEFLVMSYSHSLASGCVLYRRKELLEHTLMVTFGEMFNATSGRGKVNVGQLHDRFSHALEMTGVLGNHLSRL